jgi:hypothetical protein
VRKALVTPVEASYCTETVLPDQAALDRNNVEPLSADLVSSAIRLECNSAKGAGGNSSPAGERETQCVK